MFDSRQKRLGVRDPAFVMDDNVRDFSWPHTFCASEADSSANWVSHTDQQWLLPGIAP